LLLLGPHCCRQPPPPLLLLLLPHLTRSQYLVLH
jgi:hypothetical protein